ncbi:MAG: phosphohistidine phosphatase SixA [Thermodesulfobacteriota bacterium]|nr:phosphohistidine phosphatase SixA [Thermodesulfobacteriota bacterium]
MALLLVQHGKSLPKDEDPEQGLSDEGVLDVKRIADAAKKYGLNISCIKHSGKKRARQTADIFTSALQPELGVQEIGGIKPMDDVASFADSISSGEDLMLVGHLPFMEKLVSFLITGSIAKPVIKFQNGGIVCLDEDMASHWWVIKWTLMPEIK